MGWDESMTTQRTPDAAAPATEPAVAVPDTQPFQFTLRQLLLAVTAVSVAAGTIYWLGPLGIIIVGAIAVAYLLWLTAWSRLNLAVSAILGLVVLTALFISMDTTRGGIAPRMQCGNHLKQIAISLQNYHDVYGSFPPAYIADASGKPMHSWRVLILPFAGEKSLYDAYDFSEPWDGPHNSKLHSQMPPYFCCPAHSGQPTGETDYLAVVGPGTVWPGSTTTKFTQITDGTACTLLVVEAHGSGIHWMEPRDLHLVQMPLAINPPRGAGISSPHGGTKSKGATAAFADGHTQFLPSSLTPAELTALLTIAGGEPTPLP
jgi:prepilin-type processing-associated H-X9-DG protein